MTRQTSAINLRLDKKITIGPETQKILDLVNQNKEIKALWRVTNVVAQVRLHMTDHGVKHFQIVANNALTILDFLHRKKIKTQIEEQYHYNYDNAQTVVLMASLLHDIGMTVQRENHEVFSLFLANDLLNELFSFMPDERRVILRSETLHAIISHRKNGIPLTLEAGIVRVADALDLTRRRVNKNRTSPLDIHSVSAAAIDEVEILPGTSTPIKVNITMNHTAGLFHVDELIKKEVEGSGMANHLQINVFMEKQDKRELFKQYLKHQT